jgi:desulfoferrodoxin (superoxide reductase-like protein)
MKQGKLCPIITVALILGWVMCFSLWAHGPKSIKLHFKSDVGKLQVEVRHPVKNPTRHFIKRIRVLVNDRIVADVRYTKQTSPEAHSVDFSLKGVGSGDLIVVKATCNKFGGKKARIKVE